MLCQKCGRRAGKCPRCRRLPAALSDYKPMNGPKLLVPQPPPLELKARSAIALVTIVFGDEAEACFRSSGPLMQRYADEHSYDMVVLRSWRGHTEWPMSAKFQLGRVLDSYHAFLYVDADVLLRPGCIDIVQAVGSADWAAVDERPFHLQSPNGRNHMARYAQFLDDHGFNIPTPFYFNCGVQWCEKPVQPFLLPPTFPIRVDHCSEQHYINAAVYAASMRGEVTIRSLDRRCNWENWQDPGFLEAPKDAVLHFSGGGELRMDRAWQMAEAVKRGADDYFGFAPPKLLYPTSHHYYMDARHVGWIHSELSTGRYRRCLEIGSYHGYSTCAFLDAVRRGWVDEFHVCEPRVTAELVRTVNHYGVKVVVHEERSVDLLRRDAAWDLVLVDGDHSAKTVQEETQLLLGVTAVFAHDSKGLLGCDGPPKLVEAFEQDPRYWSTEDSAFRVGERTERGLFFARKHGA